MDPFKLTNCFLQQEKSTNCCTAKADTQYTMSTN